MLDENRPFYTTAMRTAIVDTADIRPGGEYWPPDCRPLFSTAIVVPYRQREEQLNTFLIYLHNFLRQQRIHYRIILVEQFDQRPFNRAKMFNIGFVYARRLGFPCVVMQDVDLMPIRLGQLYACSRRPRHMCAALDEFRFNLPYRSLFGGAVALQAEQFEAINGMSNVFDGWGGEDDDMFRRLDALAEAKAAEVGREGTTTEESTICRFPREYSEYAMLTHAKEPKSAERYEKLRTGSQRFGTDGLNSLKYEEREYFEHALFTLVSVIT